MVKASERFTLEDRGAIAKAVAAAEKRTAGEIVPVVATTSDRYDRAEDTFGLWLAIVVIAVVWELTQGVRPATGDWEMGFELALRLAPILAILVGSWIVGAVNRPDATR